MNGKFKGLIYGAGAICIVVLAVKLFVHVLPWLLIIGLAAYVLTKVTTLIKNAKAKKNSQNFTDNGNYESKIDSYSEDDDYNGDVIDVDYEEVDKNER